MTDAGGGRIRFAALLNALASALGASPDSKRKDGSSTGSGNSKSAPSPPVSPANPYQKGVDQIRSTATWLIAAFAAVATVMLAGSQLSSVGKLTMADDPLRLWTALIAAFVAVGATIYAIFGLTNVLAPVMASLGALRVEGASESPLAKLAADDSGLLAGRTDVPALLDDYETQRKNQFSAFSDQTKAHKELDEAINDDAKKFASIRSIAADKRRDRADAEVGVLRKTVVALTQLSAYLQVSSRFEKERTKVIWSGAAAAIAIIAFAWAANPPTLPAEGAKVLLQPRPVGAQLVLTPAGVTELSGVLGAECAMAAGQPRGVPMIVLGATTSAIEIVVPSGESCAQTSRLQLEPRLGHASPTSEARIAPIPTTTQSVPSPGPS